MGVTDLWVLFSDLGRRTATAAAELPAAQIPGRAGDYIGKGPDGEVVVLLRTAQKVVLKPPLRLRHIEVDYGARYCIAEADVASFEGDFIAIRCVGAEQPTRELFVRTVEVIVTTVPIEPSAAQVEALISGLIELFRQLSQPPRRSIKGFWAELFVIENSALPESMVAAWHSDVDEKFDFSGERAYVEVKATEQAVRVHEFSLAQLRPDDGVPVVIASLLLRREAAGTSVLDLARRIDKRLSGKPALRAKLWRNVATTLGVEFDETIDVSFSEAFAKQELRAIDAETIPCVALPLPPGVLEVQLKVDVTVAVKSAQRGQSIIDQRVGLST